MIIYGVRFWVDFLNYYLVYRWMFHVPFQKKAGMTIGVSCGACVLAVGLCVSKVLDYEGYTITLCSLAALLLLAKEKRLKVAALFPIATFIAGVVNILGSYLLSSILKMSYADFMGSNFWRLAMGLCFPLLFSLFLLFFKRLRAESEMISFSLPQYLIALLGAGCLFVIIAVSQGVMEGQTEYSLWRRPLAICLVVVGILFAILIIWQLLMEKRALQYKLENEYYRTYFDKQEAHIRKIVESDQKIRRFRHDINAHLTALEQSIQAGDLQQLDQYIKRMREETHRFEVQKKYTGLGAVDAVISEWHQKAMEENIQWDWEGVFLTQTEIEVFDLCVIFSNLLSNAVEAVRLVEEGREKRISVNCGSFRGRVCIRISNTCKLDAENRGQFATTKKDAGNHGFGMANIQSIVDKADGEFYKNVEQGIFKAEIIL